MAGELVGKGLVSSLNIEVGMKSRKDGNEQDLGVKAQSSCAGNNGQQWETPIPDLPPK